MSDVLFQIADFKFLVFENRKGFVISAISAVNDLKEVLFAGCRISVPR
jgi:hypothetical protein